MTPVPVHDAPVSRDDVPEILDLEGSLEAAREEATERSDDGGEEGHPEGVEVEGEDGEGGLGGHQTLPRPQSLW